MPLFSRRRLFAGFAAIRRGGRRVRPALRLGALLRRPGVGSFRRHALLRSALVAAEEPRDAAALVHEPREGRMADVGAEPLQRPAARARRGAGMAPLLCGSRELAAADRRPEHPDRSGVVGARLAGELRRAEARQRSRHRVRRAAADRRRAGVALPLRPSRRRNAVAACGRTQCARRHAARQRHHHDRPRSGDPRRGVSTGTSASNSGKTSPSRWCRRGTGRRAA